MENSFWEDFISLKSQIDGPFEVLPRASEHKEADKLAHTWEQYDLPIEAALERDDAPLPATEDREGYYGPNHYSYWVSGLLDFSILS